MSVVVVSGNLVTANNNKGVTTFKVFGCFITQGAYMDHCTWANNPSLVTTSVEEVANWCFEHPEHVVGAYAFST